MGLKILRQVWRNVEGAGAQPVRLTHPLLLSALILSAGLATSAYLLTSSRLSGIGFPLDDAWIHQTYARNLVQQGEWAFLPGQPSAGSTSPLWSALLAVGYRLDLSFFAWAYLLGSLCLFGLAWVGEAWLRGLQPQVKGLLPWAGFFLAGEWHFVWAAVSGMETLLVGLLVLLVVWMTGLTRGRRWVWVGLLIGVAVWVRPDGITLLGPAAFVLWLVEPGWRARLRSLLWLFSGLLAVLGPYLLFNLSIQGSLLPNTFYAKQAEYALERQVPLLVRLLNELKLPLIGGGVFLLPGAVWFAWQAWKKKHWPALAGLLWFLGYALLYALRLPVIYQYGRYFMPAMPVYFVLGLAGTVDLVNRIKDGRFTWLLTRVWLLSAAVVWLVFIGLGAGRYAQDVAIINTEMVAVARWVSANTPPGSLIAAHDIGALGYYGNRPLVDLAGLVSPEVIPFIRDETRIAAWLDELGVDYLVVFEGWYISLPAGKVPAFQTNGIFSPLSGGTNLWVYDWRP